MYGADFPSFSWPVKGTRRAMTEVDGAGTEPRRGTAAHYMYFLDWAENKGELPATAVQNWRTASIKVLEIEDDWQDVNVVDFDLDAHLRRFETLRRTAYTTGSLSAYKSRARTGIEMYRAWESGSPNWRPKIVPRGAAKAGSKKASNPTSSPPTVPAVDLVPKGEVGGYVPHHSALIEYPFPLRPGLRALIALPEDLTKKEAKRVARFVESLAFSDQVSVSDQLSLTTGEAPAE
jgi:hypothetical protein